MSSKFIVRILTLVCVVGSMSSFSGCLGEKELPKKEIHVDDVKQNSSENTSGISLNFSGEENSWYLVKFYLFEECRPFFEIKAKASYGKINQSEWLFAEMLFNREKGIYLSGYTIETILDPTYVFVEIPGFSINTYSRKEGERTYDHEGKPSEPLPQGTWYFVFLLPMSDRSEILINISDARMKLLSSTCGNDTFLYTEREFECMAAAHYSSVGSVTYEAKLSINLTKGFIGKFLIPGCSQVISVGYRGPNRNEDEISTAMIDVPFVTTISLEDCLGFGSICGPAGEWQFYIKSRVSGGLTFPLFVCGCDTNME